MISIFDNYFIIGSPYEKSDSGAAYICEIIGKKYNCNYIPGYPFSKFGFQVNIYNKFTKKQKSFLIKLKGLRDI